MYKILLKENNLLRAENLTLRNQIKEFNKLNKPEVVEMVEDVFDEVLDDTCDELDNVSAEQIDEIVEDVLEESDNPDGEHIKEVLEDVLEEVYVNVIEEVHEDKHKHIPRYKCIKCNYKYKPNCAYCKNII